MWGECPKLGAGADYGARSKRARTRNDETMKWRRGRIGEEDEPGSSTMAWSASNPWADSHGQEEGIQVENENASKRKRRKSCGVPPKSFHRSVHMVGSASSKKTNPSSVQTLLKRAGRSVNYRSFADKYQAFGQQNPFLEFPFQEPAMKALDDLTMKYRKECENNNKHHDDDDDSEDNHDDAVDDPMWSSEPRIFAVEKSSAGKRRYIVATLGRFLHHYWRFREPSVRHFYELIREKEPCRLYFGMLHVTS